MTLEKMIKQRQSSLKGENNNDQRNDIVPQLVKRFVKQAPNRLYFFIFQQFGYFFIVHIFEIKIIDNLPFSCRKFIDSCL